MRSRASRSSVCQVARSNTIRFPTFSVFFALFGMATPQWIVDTLWFWDWFWLFGKTFVVVTMFLWVRATFPRFRYDQIMRLGWKVFIPLTIVWLVFIAAWMQTPFSIWR